MEISHVMRGQEFVSSTPKFLSLYDALEVTPPIFATLPPILGESGTKKLSKRDGAKDVLDYRAEGYLPDALVNFLALLGWNPGTEEEMLDRETLIFKFDIERVQRSGAHFNEEKLLHINQQWMRKLSDEAFMEAGAFRVPDQEGSTEKLLAAIPLLKERAHTFAEAREILSSEFAWLFERPVLDREKLTAKEPVTITASGEKAREALTRPALTSLLKLIQALPEDVSTDLVKERLMPYADAEEAKQKGGRGACLWPLRYALSGLERSPDPFTLISLLGPTESASRVEAAFAIL